MSDCRIYTENMSAAPRITRHPKDKGTKVDRPKPIVERPKTTTAPSIFRPTSCFSGRNENHSAVTPAPIAGAAARRSEEHTSELQSLMRISYAVFCLKKKKK